MAKANAKSKTTRVKAKPKAKPKGPYHVYCYHCGKRMEVGQRTMSTSCPQCHKPIMVEDIVVKGYKGVMRVETCGKLVVTKRGNVVAQQHVIAHDGIEVEGQLHCKEAITAGQVVIHPKADWKGDLRAPSLIIEEGAMIRGGYFRIPNDPLADHRHQESEEQAANQSLPSNGTRKKRESTRKKKPS